jgi:hypothetical protein
LSRLFAVLFAAVLMVGGPALAQDAPSARQLELSRRYVQVMQSDQLEQVIRTMLMSDPGMDADGMPAEDRQFLIDLAAELVTDLMPTMMEQLIPVYAEVFTEAELEALVAFYDTDMGRSIARKTVESLPEVNAAMMTVMPQILDKMIVRMCERYGCDPADVRDEVYRGAGIAPAGAAPARTK